MVRGTYYRWATPFNCILYHILFKFFIPMLKRICQHADIFTLIITLRLTKPGSELGLNCHAIMSAFSKQCPYVTSCRCGSLCCSALPSGFCQRIHSRAFMTSCIQRGTMCMSGPHGGSHFRLPVRKYGVLAYIPCIMFHATVAEVLLRA